MTKQHQPRSTLFFIIAGLTTLSLISCGGSDDSAANSSSAEQSADAVLDINQLVAANDFSFTTKSTIEVEIDLAQYSDQRAYLNIYRSYQLLDSGQYYPDPASRILASALTDGKINHSFIGLQQQGEYLIEIWRYDGQQPHQQTVTVVDNRLTMQ
ncbi:MAG: hypothetical protein HRU23_07985 [Gammaproteobacteria bacterium]|nr:hypothetical protein [Gammaproteobacteria bacterium]